MNDDIVKRIGILMDHLGMNGSSFAKELGYSSSEKISRLFRKDKAKPSYEIIFDISNKFAIILNAEWLILGNGEMLKKDMNYPGPQKQLIVNESIIGYRTQSPTGFRLVPILSDKDLAMEPGTYINDNIDLSECIQLPKKMLNSKDAYYAAPKVKGDSMSPTLQDNSYVVSRLLARQEWGNMPTEQIYIITDTSGKSAIKRVKNRLKQGFITLMSDNPDKATYANFNLEIGEISNIWLVEWYITAKMPNIHDQYYHRLQSLEDKYEYLEKTIHSHNKKK